MERIDKTVLDLWLGILLWSVICELVLLIFVQDKLGCSLGLAAGAVLACGCVYHMWWALDRGLSNEAAAQQMIRRHSLIRYGVIILVFGIIMVTKAANPLTAFLGIMGLKAAAYIQPLTHRLLHGRKGGVENEVNQSDIKEVNL